MLFKNASDPLRSTLPYCLPSLLHLKGFSGEHALNNLCETKLLSQALLLGKSSLDRLRDHGFFGLEIGVLGLEPFSSESP